MTITGTYPDLDLAILDIVGDVFGLDGGTEIPADLDEVMPFVFVHRHGGTDDKVTDRQIVDLHVFAPTRATARDLAKQIRQELTSKPHQINGVVVDRVTTLSGPQEIPYGTNKRRLVATYAATSRRTS